MIVDSSHYTKCFWKGAHMWNVLRMILSPFELFIDESGEGLFQKPLLSTTFLMSKLLKYSFLVVFSSFLQRFCYLLYFNLSSCDLFLNELLRNLDIFVIYLCISFVIKGTSFAGRYFCLIGVCLSNILNIFSLKLPLNIVKLIKGKIVNIIVEFSIVKFFVIEISYNFW